MIFIDGKNSIFLNKKSVSYRVFDSPCLLYKSHCKYFSNKWNVVFSVKYSPWWLLWNELVNSNMEIYLMMLGECSYIQTQASTTPRMAHVES